MLAQGVGGGTKFRSNDKRQLHLDSPLLWLLSLPPARVSR